MHFFLYSLVRKVLLCSPIFIINLLWKITYVKCVLVHPKLPKYPFPSSLPLAAMEFNTQPELCIIHFIHPEYQSRGSLRLKSLLFQQ